MMNRYSDPGAPFKNPGSVITPDVLLNTPNSNLGASCRYGWAVSSRVGLRAYGLTIHRTTNIF